MVSILKYPEGDSKGVVVFTHKERGYFDEGISIIDDKIRSLKEEYLIGMYWGMYIERPQNVPYVDFHLARENTVEFKPESTAKRIPMAAYNFIPSRFQPMATEKIFDILSIGHPIKRKRFSELLSVIRELYDSGYSPTVLLLCPVPDSPDRLKTRQWDHELFRMYRDEFSNAEKENVHLVAPVETTGAYPVPNSALPYLYNASQVFTLFSSAEGNPRVINESLLCNTPVIARDDLRGSGLDYLDEGNSVTLSNLDEARDVFIDILEGELLFDFNTDPLREQICEDHTIKTLRDELEVLFVERELPFEGRLELDNLARRLPSHELTLPANLRHGLTNDLRSRKALIQFIDTTLDTRTTPDQWTSLYLNYPDIYLRERLIEYVGSRMESTVRWVDDSLPFPVYDPIQRAVRTLRR